MTKPGKPYFRTVILMRMELFFFILYFLNFLERIYKIGLKNLINNSVILYISRGKTPAS